MKGSKGVCDALLPKLCKWYPSRGRNNPTGIHAEGAESESLHSKGLTVKSNKNQYSQI